MAIYFQAVKENIRQEAAAVECWLAELKVAFRAKASASFDSMTSRTEEKLKDMHSLQCAFEASIKDVWSDIQGIHHELEPTIQV